jgi:hypothetical protein
MHDDEIITDPGLLAMIDQVMAAHHEHTGKRSTAMHFDGWHYELCDQGHWHRIGLAHG